MTEPEIFFPRERLELPYYFDDPEVDLNLIRDSRLMKFGFSAVKILGMNLGIMPSWYPDADGSGGVMQITNFESGEDMSFKYWGGTNVTTANTDGFRFYDGIDKIITFGVHDVDVQHVWFGVTNLASLEDADSSRLTVLKINGDGESWTAADNKLFPK